MKRARPWALLILAVSSLLSISYAESGGRFVTPVALAIIRKPAHFFNLQGKTVRFTPQPDGSYFVETLPNARLAACEDRLEYSQGTGHPARSWGADLPFEFPFAGKTWGRLYINNNGNLTFERPESELYPERNPWAAGGMRSVAKALDERSMAGSERMIAALWSTWDDDPRRSTVCRRADKDGLVVNWDVTRLAWGHRPAGRNQAHAGIVWATVQG